MGFIFLVLLNCIFLGWDFGKNFKWFITLVLLGLIFPPDAAIVVAYIIHIFFYH